jgi:PPK2 family polyphosphate:nucleotide phosphotransferase
MKLLNDIPTAPDSKLDKDDFKDLTKGYQDKISDLQEKLFAESKQSLLILFQGMDAAGKGGAVKQTFEEVNPMGVRVYGFKKPTDAEFAHDFLWRVHAVVPPKGMIHIFDRSHYEDVLIQRVHNWIDEKRVFQRFKHINQFEELLVEENKTTVIKFFLHVSKDEQLKRLNERKNDPEKMWKHNDNDFVEREHWDDYAKAYESVFEHCSKYAPWHIIPTDDNWYKEYLLAKIVCETLEQMNPQYPSIKQH